MTNDDPFLDAEKWAHKVEEELWRGYVKGMASPASNPITRTRVTKDIIQRAMSQARQKAIADCAQVAKDYGEQDCDDADEFTMAAKDIEDAIRELMEKT